MSAVKSAQPDTEIATEFIRGLESLQPENDAPLANFRPEELLEELNSANSTADIIEGTGTHESGPGVLDRPPVKELLDVQRSYQCYKKLRDETEIKNARELRPGDFIAVKIRRVNPWWNYLIVTEVIGDVIYGVCLCTPNGDDHEKVNFVSNYSTSFQGLVSDSMQSSPEGLKVWEVPLQWSTIHKVHRYDHLSCTDIIDEARKEIGNEYPWDIGKKIAEKVKFRLTKCADEICIDMDEKLSLKDLLNIKQSYQWCTKSEDGEDIKQIRDLRCGDHIAVKIKRSKMSWFNPWWNHMIVTGVDADIDVIYVVSLCIPNSDPEKVMFESDSLSFSHLKEYFRSSSHESNLQIWEIPLSWHMTRKIVRFNYAHNPFSPNEVVCRAREKLGEGKTWDLYTRTSEHFAREVKTSKGTDTLREKADQGIALTCEVGMGTTSLIVKKLHWGLKLVLWVVKQIIKIIFRSGPRSAVHLVNIAKLVRVLEFFGIGIGAIVDIIMCAIAIYIKYKRLKNREITKNEFNKYVTQKVAELGTNLIFAIFSIPCLFIPIPILGCVVSIIISIIGCFVSKFVNWVVGKVWDYFHQDC